MRENEIKDDLNTLLQSYIVYQNNVKSLHFKTKGPNFFQIHQDFSSDLYDRLSGTIDTLAERILAIDWRSFEIPFKYNSDPPIQCICDSDDMTMMLRKTRESIESIISQIKFCIIILKETDDEATLSLLADIQLEEQKDLWKLKAYLDEV